MLFLPKSNNIVVLHGNKYAIFFIAIYDSKGKLLIKDQDRVIFGRIYKVKVCSDSDDIILSDLKTGLNLKYTRYAIRFPYKQYKNLQIFNWVESGDCSIEC